MKRLLGIMIVTAMCGGCALVNAMKQDNHPAERMDRHEEPEKGRDGVWVGGTPLGVGLCGIGAGSIALFGLIRHHRNARTVVVPSAPRSDRDGELVDAGGVRNPWECG